MKKIEQILKQFLLDLLLIFNPTKATSSSQEFSNKNKILFVRLNRIGDALVTTPLIHLVKSKLNCKVFVLADRKNHFIFRNNFSVDEVIVFEKGIKGILHIKKFVRDNNIDTIVDLHDDISTTVSFIIAVSNCRNKFGLKKGTDKIYTQTVDRLNPALNHVIKRNLELLKLFNLKYSEDEVSVKYYPDKKYIDEARSIVEQKRLKDKFLLGINISAGSQARFWGVDRYKSLIKSLANYDINYLIFSDPKDSELANAIAESKVMYPVSDKFDIFVSGILQLDMLFTPDTSVVHIASIKKIPVFGVYVKYNTKDMIWSPYNTDFECVITEEPNLDHVSFEEVIQKFIPFLEKHLNAKRNSIL